MARLAATSTAHDRFGLAGLRTGRHGFTVVELLVVLIMLTILAGVIAPRLVSGSSRSAEADVRRAAELMSTAGRRDTLTSQQIAIDYDGATSTMRMLVLRLPSAADAARGSEPEWVDDRMTMRVELKDVRLLSATADGAELDARRFRVEFKQSGVRPGLVLMFGQDADKPLWTVSLPPGAFRARVSAGMGDIADGEQAMIDLDQVGKAEEPW